MTKLLAIIIGALFLFLVGYIGYLFGNRKTSRVKTDALKRQSPILKGQVSEQIALLLPDFSAQHPDLNLSEARFIGKPIDFLFFKGLDDKEITEVVFVEVKTGESSLSSTERKLRDAIRNKKVDWREYRVPRETKAPGPLQAAL